MKFILRQNIDETRRVAVDDSAASVDDVRVGISASRFGEVDSIRRIVATICRK